MKTNTVKSVLSFLSTMFSNNQVEVDKSVHNPARICKLYGTIAAKGDSTADRPHRIARMIDIPAIIQVVPREKLIELANQTCTPEQPAGQQDIAGSENSLALWLERNGVAVHGPKPWNGGDLWDIDLCPWRPDEHDGGAWVAQLPSGEIIAGCHHNKCAGKGWHDLRDVYEPGWRSKRADAPPGEGRTQADKLLEIAKNCELFLSDEGKAYATFEQKGHYETHPVNSSVCRNWLIHLYRLANGSPPGKEAVNTALSALEASASYDGKVLPVFNRVGGKGNEIYVDICDANWTCLKINREGFQVIDRPPIKFRRSKGSKPLVLPGDSSVGDIAKLREFVRVSDDDWALLLAWIVAAFRPTGPYPVLFFAAEQGTGKSTIARMTLSIIDPSISPLRTQPSNERDLMISANNGWCLAFDNLSKLLPWFSDALCRLSTGGGFATRKLYTDDEEIIINAQRPVILTSISELATRPDLIDRSIIINLSPMKPSERREEIELWASFDMLAPTILAAILRAVSSAIRSVGHTDIIDCPRMADFIAWGTAAEESLGLPGGAVLDAYNKSQRSAIEIALEAAAIYGPLKRLLSKKQTFKGTAADLLKQLRTTANQDELNCDDWPESPRSLADDLRRLSPVLRKMEWIIERAKTSGSNSRVLWEIRSPD